MPKKLRDALLIVFVILFIIITTITSLYASGYKFNLTWPLNFNRLLQKTGMLAVASKPSRAIIYLNGKPQHDLSFKPWKKDYLSTPVRVKNVLPDNYELTLKLEGYWPYQQNITIKSGETTFVEDVILFKTSDPLLIKLSAETNLLLSPDNRYLFNQLGQEIINLKTEASRSLINPLNPGINDLKIITVNHQLFIPGKWLKNNKFFQNGLIYDPLKPENDNNYTTIIGSGVNSWYFDETSNAIYYENQGTISQFLINNQINTLLITDENCLAYHPYQDKIFVITKNQQNNLNGYFLKDLSSDGSWALPVNGHYLFVPEINGYLSIYDDKNKTLYLFNGQQIINGPITINGIQNWQTISHDSIIYTNNLEIYTFDLNTQRSELITRRSEALNDIIWNASGNYLIFSDHNTLNVFDFKNRTSTNLLKADKIASPVLDERNKNLYFWASYNEQAGIYKINLQ
jgi:hypothetical protein